MISAQLVHMWFTREDHWICLVQEVVGSSAASTEVHSISAECQAPSWKYNGRGSSGQASTID